MENFLLICGALLLIVSFISLIIFCVIFTIKSFKKVPAKKHAIRAIISLCGIVIGVIMLNSGTSMVNSAQNASENSYSYSDESDSSSLESESDDSDSYSGIQPTSITKEQYEKIKINMTKSQLEKIIKKPVDVFDDGETTDWYYMSDNLGTADIYIDNKTNKVIKKEEQGILSEDSDTLTDASGVHKNQSGTESENVDSSTLEDEIKSAAKPQIGEIEEIEINDDMGKNDGGKIVLIHIKSNDVNKRVALYQTSLIMEKEFKISKVNEVVVFWDADVVDKYGKESVGTLAKIGITKDIAKKIHWDNFDYNNFKDITDNYYVDNLLK